MSGWEALCSCHSCEWKALSSLRWWEIKNIFTWALAGLCQDKRCHTSSIYVSGQLTHKGADELSWSQQSLRIKSKNLSIFSMGRGEEKTIIVDFLPFFSLVLNSLYVCEYTARVCELCAWSREQSVSPCAAALWTAMSRDVLCSCAIRDKTPGFRNGKNY